MQVQIHFLDLRNMPLDLCSLGYSSINKDTPPPPPRNLKEIEYLIRIYPILVLCLPAI